MMMISDNGGGLIKYIIRKGKPNGWNIFEEGTAYWEYKRRGEKENSIGESDKRQLSMTSRKEVHSVEAIIQVMNLDLFIRFKIRIN